MYPRYRYLYIRHLERYGYPRYRNSDWRTPARNRVKGRIWHVSKQI